MICYLLTCCPWYSQKRGRMTHKEMADRLNNSEYGFEISKELKLIAKDSGIVIVSGRSDDLMEFEGAICDDASCYSGGIVYLSDNDLLKNDCEDDRCPYFEKTKSQAKTIEALWGKDGYSWTYKTDIPHETFEIFEDGEKYCKGIVFDIKELKKKDAEIEIEDCPAQLRKELCDETKTDITCWMCMNKHCPKCGKLLDKYLSCSECGTSFK